MNTNIASLYDFTLQQMAAESYSEGVDLTRTADVKAQLRLGTNREGYKGGPSDLNEGYPGYTRMTSQQADEFLSKFKIVHQWSDNPSTGKIPGSRPLPEGDPAFARLNIGELLANTGLSATLILKKNADGSGSMEYTLAIRSTEFRDWADGGDGQRDKTGADVKGIAYTGFALAQQYALEQYYQWLKDNGKLPPGAKLNVTGYSLGGNLATVFTEMHQAEMGGGQTVTMNGAGRGTWNASAGGLSEMINYFHSVLLNPALAPNPAGGMYTTERGAAIGKTGMAFDPKSMYQDERYTWAVSATKIKFGLSWNSLADENRTGTLADSIITQMYGFESINNTNLTANSGTHGPALKVGIESQPAREGIFGGFIGTGDFGNGHSITLIADSLALQRTMHKLDTNFELTHFINLLPSTSFRDTKNGLDANYEADPLENVLDALRRAILGAGVTKTEFKDGASGFGDITKRETYHANIKALTDSAAFKALEGNVILDPLYGKSATALFGLAKNGDIDATAYGYALKQLNPFAILGAPALYDKFNTHGELKLYDPATGQGELSEQWLEDRAALLRAVNMRNTQNVSTGTVLDPMARSGQVTDFSYFDPTVPYDPAKPATKIDITTRQMGAEFAQHQTVSFGGDGPDTLVGTNSNLGDHLYGGAGADTLKGYAGADLLEGGMDDDQLYGGHGKDTLMGGSGSDHLWGEGGGDKLVGGSGKDYIYGGADDDTIYGDVVDPDSGAVAFDDELYGDSGRDTLYGGGGNDTLVGGAGDDRLYGGGGNDTYVFDGGVDVIDDSSGTDTVRLDISLDQVTFSRDGNDLLVYVGGSRTDNFLRVVNGADGSVVEYFESPGYGRLSFAEMQAKFDSVGRTLGRSDMRDLYDEEALQEESPHYLMGSKGNDIFSAGDGWVLEPNSNPPYYMWDGVQYYWDKAGNDTYVLDTGFGGYISIWDESGEDTIRFGNGISPDNVKFSLSTGYLRLIVNGNDNDANNNYKPPDSVWRCPTDVVELPGWGLGGRIEWAVFADGTVWNLQEKVTACAAPYWIDTAGGDRIGWAMDLAKAIALGLSDREIMSLTNLAAWDDTSEVVSGLGGNDELYSGDGGSDIFIGGVGNDTIYGNGTNNVFVFNVGDGQDTLRMSAAFAFVQNRLHTDANLDILRFGVGIAPEDIVFERRGKDMIVRTGHGDDQVTVADWADATERTNRGVNRIEFADGTAWDSDDILLLTAALPIVGDDGYNVLLGDAGDNILEGGAGDDALKGGDGSDTYLLKLGAGKVTVVETGGEFDVIRFGSGIASGGISLERIGMDLILRNTVTGDEVAVKQWGQSDLNRAEAVQFADGTAWSASDISSKLGVAAGTGTSGDDLLAAWWGENGALHGLAGDDLLIGSSDDNVLDGGPGNDTVNGGLGSDVYLFDLGGGQDTVEETGGSLDAVRFGAGIASTDIVLTRSAYDLVLSIRGTDDRLTFLRWGEGETHRIERVEFADGSSWDASVMAHIMNVEQTGSASDDILWSWTDENATLRGLGGADRLYGGNGSDVLDGGPGDDFVLGGNGDDVFVFGRGYGKDMVSDKGGKDAIRLAEGVSTGDVAMRRNGDDLSLSINGTDDVLTMPDWFYQTDYRVEAVAFADGTIWDTVDLTSARFVGTEGVDNLVGSVENDFLEGRGGDDSLMAYDGDDSLDAGPGNDLLAGGMGNDVFRFGRGDGQDTIREPAPQGNLANALARPLGSDTILFKPGVAASDVRLWRDDLNLYIGINGTSDTINVVDWFLSTTRVVECVEFADGTVWGTAELAAAKYAGTEGADTFIGDDRNDVFEGRGGNDTISAGAGDDVLDGGLGNDLLEGGAGNDCYIFAPGYGQDTVVESAGVDVVKLGVGLTAANVQLWRDAANLYIGIVGSSDVLTVQNWFELDANRIESIQFADGTIWGTAVLESAGFAGTEGSDFMMGGSGSDRLEGRGGDDSLMADAGDDTLDGGAGSDSLDGGVGNDRYIFGRGYGQDTIQDADDTAGNSDTVLLKSGVAVGDVVLFRDAANLYLIIEGTSDKLTVSGWFDSIANRVERLEFADGTVWDATVLANAKFVGTEGPDYMTGGAGNDIFEARGGDDTLVADDGNDVLDGGTGVDTLDGGTGNDSYLFGSGYGQDTITDAAGTDVIKLSADLTTANVQLWRDTSNLYIGVANSTDVLTVQSWFDANTNRVESVQFADGTIWSAGVLAAAAFGGTPGPDSIYGTTGNDTLLGFGGDDSISGDAGNDTLDGGTGNDSLDGGAGNDSYVFGIGYGQDSITDASGTDVIKLGAGLTSTNVQIWRDTSTLYLGITGGTDVLTVQGWFDATTNRVESVQFVDGAVWNAATLAAAAFGGTAGPDSISGTTGSNTLYGFGGDDSIYADAGNDTLDGGTGNDLLDGGAGNDIYKFGRGYEQDTVAETSGAADLIQFDANTVPADVLVSRDASNLYLSILGTMDRLVVQNWYLDANYRVETVSFADGANWTIANLNARTSSVTEAADFYWGTTGNDAVNGLGGNDQLVGNEGNDSLSGGVGNDLLDGGSGTDTMAGGTGDDIYIVDATTDVVTENAAEGSDTVRSVINYTIGANLERLELLEAGGAINGTGNSLANTLAGNSSNNTLNGGTGADTLMGGQGNDTYVVDDLADIVTENLNEGTDLVNASVTWTLGANVEKLTLTGAASINGTGNELANTLTGNSGANILAGGAGNDALNGGAGADTLLGGLGNDSFTVDNAADVITEQINEGTDTVSANLSWTLGANLEKLTLTGTTAINATGNELNNVLTGNSAANVLVGGAGADTLVGGAGNDTYVMGCGYGADTIQENDATAGNTDVLQCLSGIATDQLWFRHVGNNLEVSVIGTADKATLSNWYLGSQYHVEQFKTSDGKTLLDSKVNALVDAMAAFSPPAAGQTTLPAAYQTALNPVIAANWQ